MTEDYKALNLRRAALIEWCEREGWTPVQSAQAMQSAVSTFFETMIGHDEDALRTSLEFFRSVSGGLTEVLLEMEARSQ
jgi:hypothetical protein